MSRENVELVLRGMRAAAARPKPDFATVNVVYDSEHVFVGLAARFEAGEMHGARGFQDTLRRVDEVGAWEFAVEGAVDVAPDKVLAVGTIRLQGSASGATAEQRNWWLVAIRDGKITRTEGYTDPADALEAARRPE